MNEIRSKPNNRGAASAATLAAANSNTKFRNIALGSILALCAATSWADSANTHQEWYSFDGTQFPGDWTSHGSPTSYFKNTSDPVHGSSTTQSVEFSVAPAPFVQVNTSSYGPGSLMAVTFGAMSYVVSISGPVLAWVPVVFAGRFSMEGPNLTSELGNGVASSGLVSFQFGGAHFSDACGGYCAVNAGNDDNSSIFWNYTNFGVTAVSGNINGTVRILTDKFGRANTSFSMMAQAASRQSTGGTSAMAFVDPEFHIDTTWLASHPDVVLSLPDGVGNGLVPVTSVPEPESLALMLSGLGLLAAVVRRRDRQR